ncbi:C-type lectin domain family 4 member E-like [Clupea harengus]|uniref:C-type lectin domain family 4 member E-like n=1 Tax=Clupea harengus TaxID=7950 RepID=A0A6P8GRZ3_CLUHA|nr:C-type lectin domain family 4 member E-like [Clupea harengus]
MMMMMMMIINCIPYKGVKNCADDWEYFDGSCYHFSTDTKNWIKSRDACVTIGGHLVIINSQQEMDFLKAKANHWIGLTDAKEEGKWRWVDNTPLTNLKLVKPKRYLPLFLLNTIHI